MAKNLLDLPPEILWMVMGYITRPGDLCALDRTCKPLHAFAAKGLYESITLFWDRHGHTPIMVNHFSRKGQRNLQHTKRLVICGVEAIVNRGLSKEEWTSLSLIFEGVPQDKLESFEWSLPVMPLSSLMQSLMKRQTCIKSLAMREPFPDFCDTVVPSSSNLESLSFVYIDSGDAEIARAIRNTPQVRKLYLKISHVFKDREKLYCRGLLPASLLNPTKHPHLHSVHLTRFCLRWNSSDTICADGGQGTKDVNRLMELFNPRYLTSLTLVKCKGIGDLLEALSVHPEITNLKHFTLREAMDDTIHVPNFLNACTGLKSIALYIGKYFKISKDLLGAIFGHEKTLEYLFLDGIGNDRDIRPNAQGEIEKRYLTKEQLGDFRRMEKLKGFAFPYQIRTPRDYEDIYLLLPASLRTLWVRPLDFEIRQKNVQSFTQRMVKEYNWSPNVDQWGAQWGNAFTWDKRLSLTPSKAMSSLSLNSFPRLSRAPESKYALPRQLQVFLAITREGLLRAWSADMVVGHTGLIPKLTPVFEGEEKWVGGDWKIVSLSRDLEDVMGWRP